MVREQFISIVCQPVQIGRERMEEAPHHQQFAMDALTSGMRRGDEAAYRTFYNLYFDRLLRYLLVITHGQEEAAREALQLTLLRVVRYIKVFNSEEVFWSWLTVLARSCVMDEARKQRRRWTLLDRFFSHSMISSDRAQDDSETQLLALLEKCLTDLSFEERTLIERKYLAGESVRELAADSQSSEKAVDSRLVRVRRKLKDAILTHLKHEP